MEGLALHNKVGQIGAVNQRQPCKIAGAGLQGLHGDHGRCWGCEDFVVGQAQHHLHVAGGQCNRALGSHPRRHGQQLAAVSSGIQPFTLYPFRPCFIHAGGNRLMPVVAELIQAGAE